MLEIELKSPFSQACHCDIRKTVYVHSPPPTPTACNVELQWQIPLLLHSLWYKYDASAGSEQHHLCVFTIVRWSSGYNVTPAYAGGQVMMCIALLKHLTPWHYD